MSLEYCGDCDKNIDLDFDSEHEHFNQLNLDNLEGSSGLGIITPKHKLEMEVKENDNI